MPAQDGHQVFEKRGIRYNGFRIPYPLVGAVVLVVASSAVSLYQIQQLQEWREAREEKINKMDKKLSVLDSKMKHVLYQIRRIQGHPNNVQKQ